MREPTFRGRFREEYALCQDAILDLREEYKERRDVPLLVVNVIFGPLIALGMALWFAWKGSSN